MKWPAWIDALGGFVAAAVPFGAAFVAQLRKVEGKVDRKDFEEVEETVNQHDNILLGDGDDPNQTGLAEDVSEMKRDLWEIKETLSEIRDRID